MSASVFEISFYRIRWIKVNLGDFFQFQGFLKLDKYDVSLIQNVPRKYENRNLPKSSMNPKL
jgi:hypothetical protein